MTNAPKVRTHSAAVERVVVGIDLAPGSTRLARWAAASFPDATIVLTHAVELPGERVFRGPPAPLAPSVMTMVSEGAAAMLRRIGGKAVPGRFIADARCGLADEVLAEVARERDAQLIVMGKRSRRGVGARLGSTTLRLLRRTEVPVLVATGTADRLPKRVLAAIDDSDVTGSVLHWTGLLAEQWNARVLAVHVLKTAVLEHVLTAMTIEQGREPGRAAVQHQFRRDTLRDVKRLVEAGIPRRKAQSAIRFGDPVNEIGAAAKQFGADLIILGRARGAGRAIRRATIGSVAWEILRASKKPVLVVVPPTDVIEIES